MKWPSRDAFFGRASCMVLFRLAQDEEGEWVCEMQARHWVKGAPPDDLPPGVKGAILQKLMGDAFYRAAQVSIGSLVDRFLPR